MEDGGEVHHQVRRRADAAQLLERLVPDHERHRLPPAVPDQRVVVACCAVIVDRENGVAAGGRRGVFAGARGGGARHRRSSCGATHVAAAGGVESIDRPTRARQGICRCRRDLESAFRHLYIRLTGGTNLKWRVCAEWPLLPTRSTRFLLILFPISEFL